MREAGRGGVLCGSDLVFKHSNANPLSPSRGCSVSASFGERLGEGGQGLVAIFSSAACLCR